MSELKHVVPVESPRSDTVTGRLRGRTAPMPGAWTTRGMHCLVDRLSDLLEDGDESWVVVEREQLRQLQLYALQALGDHPALPGSNGIAVGLATESRSAPKHAIVGVRYRVLGTLAAAGEGNRPLRLGGPRQRLVLALLLRDVGRAVSDDALVEALWPAGPPRGARHTLQTYISTLRRVLDDPVQRDGNGYVLAAEPAAVDARRFEALVAAAGDRPGYEPARTAALLREALGLWHGEPYADLQDAPALQADVHRLQQARLEAVEDRVNADLEAGRIAQAILELETLARDHPYRERVHGLLMLALYRSGRQADALHAYQRARSVLAEELGIDPSPQLQRLQRQILAQDPSLLSPATATRPPVDAIRSVS